jgi:hypothetical protein
MKNSEKIKSLIKNSETYKNSSYFHRGEIEAKSKLSPKEVHLELLELKDQGYLLIKDALDPVIEVIKPLN